MKTSSLFVVGLLIGAVVVFAVRAASQGGPQAAEPTSTHAGHESHESAPPGPAPVPDEPAPAPAPDEPAPAPAPEHAGHGTGSGMESDRLPENEICPVMGNEVDPDVYVDYKGRRIGFCCPGCDEKFLADPEKYLKKVDAELAASKGAK